MNARRPYTTADFDLYMRAMMHAIRVMGVDHVGLGADWDGGGGVIGMEDIAALPRISARLRREGLSEADIAKIMGGNLLRVLRQVQAGAQGRRPAAEAPAQGDVSVERRRLMDASPPARSCRGPCAVGPTRGGAGAGLGGDRVRAGARAGRNR